jgi:hypothetical protein
MSRLTALNAMTLRSNAAQEAYTHQIAATQDVNQATLYQHQANFAIPEVLVALSARTARAVSSFPHLRQMLEAGGLRMRTPTLKASGFRRG